MLSFSSPEWFLLLPAFALLAWFWRTPRLHLPLRLLIAVTATLLLADPQIRMQHDALDLWVLLDRSDSTEDLVDKGLPEWQRLLEKSKPSRHDRLHLINYGAEVNELGKDGGVFTGARHLTRTGLALHHVNALADAKRPSRVLVFTDGFATEPLDEAVNELQARGIPLDYRLIRDVMPDDFRVARIQLPERTEAGEPFLLGVTVRGSKDGEVPVVIRRDGATLVETKVQVIQGVGQVEFNDRILRAGGHEYEAEVRAEGDSHSGNNKLSKWIEVTGGPRVLLVTKYSDDPMAKVLRSMNFEVEVVDKPAQLQAGRLAGCRAVVFNNVPAFEVPRDFLDALDFFVRDQGGGFLMAGGKQSFGSGGYFESSIDALLPVSMELKSEHRKLSVALAIVMDRSGSMSVNVDGKLTKMDLADAGAATAIDLLGRMDQVVVHAVDTQPEEVVGLTNLEGNRKKQAIDKVRRVVSQGGGIYVYEGLKAAWDELKKSQSGTRHVILFSDACDSEEPGDYKNLLKTMTDNGCTVSVIGLGKKGDIHAPLLEDIAKLGKGRIFFSDKPMELPKIFAQETVTIARSAFLDGAVAAKATGRWDGEKAPKLDTLKEIDGYNLSYARPDATVSLVSGDEYLAPLIAQAQRGLGRTAAVSFPLGGEFSQRVREWPAYGDFLQTLTRWLMGSDLPEGIAIRHKLDGTRLNVDLRYDPARWGTAFAQQPPVLRLIESGKTPLSLSWNRIAPGHFSLSHEMTEGSMVRGAIQAGGHALPFGPLNVGSSIEWNFEPERVSELRLASQQTGGRELLNLEQAWLRPPLIHDRPLRVPLGITLLGLVLLEALVTRTGWKLPQFAMPAFKREPRMAKMPKPKRAKVEVPLETTASPTASKPEEDVAQPSARSSRYRQAKERR